MGYVQGEYLSPFLYAIDLNDIEIEVIKKNMYGYHVN